MVYNLQYKSFCVWLSSSVFVCLSFCHLCSLKISKVLKQIFAKHNIFLLLLFQHPDAHWRGIRSNTKSRLAYRDGFVQLTFLLHKFLHQPTQFNCWRCLWACWADCCAAPYNVVTGDYSACTNSNYANSSKAFLKGDLKVNKQLKIELWSFGVGEMLMGPLEGGPPVKKRCIPDYCPVLNCGPDGPVMTSHSLNCPPVSTKGKCGTRSASSINIGCYEADDRYCGLEIALGCVILIYEVDLAVCQQQHHQRS